MHKLVFSGVAAGLIGGAMLLSGTSPASAATLPSPALMAPGDTAMVEEVQRRRGDRVHRYDRRRHGQRYRTMRPGYRHYHGGYYYASPWWHGPGFGFGITVPGFSFGLTAPGVGLPAAHVQWCMNRYRTYDPATDTYIPRVGQRARCSSPYVPW